mgnify:CR=1 FL=1
MVMFIAISPDNQECRIAHSEYQMNLYPAHPSFAIRHSSFDILTPNSSSSRTPRCSWTCRAARRSPSEQYLESGRPEMVIVRENVLYAHPTHHDKRNVIHHAGPIAISSCVRRPRAAPFVHRRVNHEPTPFHFDAKSIDFQPVRPPRGRVRALEEDEGRRE